MRARTPGRAFIAMDVPCSWRASMKKWFRKSPAVHAHVTRRTGLFKLQMPHKAFFLFQGAFGRTWSKLSRACTPKTPRSRRGRHSTRVLAAPIGAHPPRACRSRLYRPSWLAWSSNAAPTPTWRSKLRRTPTRCRRWRRKCRLCRAAQRRGRRKSRCVSKDPSWRHLAIARARCDARAPGGGAGGESDDPQDQRRAGGKEHYHLGAAERP